MRVGKRILKSDSVRRFLCWLISLYLRVVYNTSRWRHSEEEYLKPLVDKGEPFIIALWHNRVVMMPYAWRKPKPISIFTSDHRDGRLVAYTMGWFGFNAVFGSTQRTELKTIRRIVRSLKSGTLLGITPDGPRGPRMRLKSGVVAMGETVAQARARAYETIDRVDWPNGFYRRDIAWRALERETG